MLSQRQKKGRFLMCLSAYLGGLVFYAPIATYYREARGIDILQLSLIESISIALSLLLEVPWGYVADRIGARKTLSISFGTLFVSKIVFWKAHSFPVFLVERLLLAVANSGMSGVDTAYLSHADGSQKCYGIYDGCALLGLVTVSMLFPLLGDPVGQSGFLTVLSSLLAFLCILFLPDVGERMEKKGWSLHVPKLTGSMILFLLSIAFLAAVHQSVSVFIVQLCYERISLDVSLYSLPFLAVSLAGVAGGFLSERFFRLGRLSLPLCFVLTVGGCLLMTLRMIGWIIVGVVCLRLGTTLLLPWTMRRRVAMSVGYDQATVLSIHQMLFSLVEMALSPLFGWVAQKHLDACLYLAAGMVVMSSVLLLLSSPVVRRLR